MNGIISNMFEQTFKRIDDLEYTKYRAAELLGEQYQFVMDELKKSILQKVSSGELTHDMEKEC